MDIYLNRKKKIEYKRFIWHNEIYWMSKLVGINVGMGDKLSIEPVYIALLNIIQKQGELIIETPWIAFLLIDHFPFVFFQRPSKAYFDDERR